MEDIYHLSLIIATANNINNSEHEILPQLVGVDLGHFKRKYSAILKRE